jgi:glutathione S-transferase
MQEGDLTLAEGNAILRHLARAHAPELYGGCDDFPKMATIDWVLDWASNNLYPMFADVVYPVMGFKPVPEDFAPLVEKLSQNLATFQLKFLPAEQGATFVAGESLSIADYKMAPLLFLMNHAATKQVAGLTLAPGLVKYLEAILAASSKGKDFLLE